MKKSFFSKIRNNFIAGIVVLIPIGITLYLTLFIIRISGHIIPKELNPNNYLPFNIPGVEILIALFLITFIGWLSLSFIGKKFFELFNNFLKRIPILRTIYSAIGQKEGIIQKKLQEDLINVFVPTTPNPTSGFLLMLPKKDLIYLDVSFEQASKFIVSAGTTNID